MANQDRIGYKKFMAQNDTFGIGVTQASLNQTALDFPRNLANIYAAIDRAVADKSDFLALEELALTGYEANDDFQKTDNDKIYRLLQDVAAYAYARDPNLIVSIGHPWRLALRRLPAAPGLESERLKNPLFNRIDKPFNVQSFIAGGAVSAMTAKMYLFNDERGYESRYFQEWSMAAANQAGGTFGTLQVTLPDGRVIPFGRPLVEIADEGKTRRVMATHVICEERWVGSRFGGAPYTDKAYARDAVAPGILRHVGSRDGLLLLMPNASPPASLKINKHMHLVEMASRYANAVVDTDGLGSSGATFSQFGHRLTAQNGRILSFGARNSFARVAATASVLALQCAPVKAAEKAHVTIRHVFNNAARTPAATLEYKNTWDDPAYAGRAAEERTRMAALWLFDYMRKTKCQGIAEALSGGADSSYCCTIVRAMVGLAMRELGVDGFLKEMSHLTYAGKIRAAAQAGGLAAAEKACMDDMLTAVYMGTDNSSDQTLHSARTLIEGTVDENGAPLAGLGGKFMARNVQELLNGNALTYAVGDAAAIKPQRKAKLFQAVAQYLNQRTPSCTTDADVGRHLTDLDRQQAKLRKKFPEITGRLVSVADPREIVAYENIQARARQVLIMLIANAEGKMAIANPNLDEARNAYATFGGDLHSGTVNLNAFIDKEDELSDMRYLHDVGLLGALAPVRSLAAVLQLKPTAELQPKNDEGEVVQNDEDALQRTFRQMKRIAALMLDEKVETANGRRRLSAGEVFAACGKDAAFAGVDENRLHNMVRLSYVRWYGPAQNKIHGSPIAPTFGKNVDHQTSQRTPNLSGGGRDELAVLGLELMARWAEKDPAALPGFDAAFAARRAEQDENFGQKWDIAVRNRRQNAGMDFDLRGLYDRVRAEGWDSIFPPLAPDHALMVIRNAPRPN